MKIKGAHNAMKSGMVAAENIYEKIIIEEKNETPIEVKQYEDSLRESWVVKELKKSRNFKVPFKKGLFTGILNAGFISFISKVFNYFLIEIYDYY